MQGFRPQRTVNADVASLHAIPVAETVDNVRRRQGSFERSPILRPSPAGYQRWHVAKDYVSTGEALGVRRRNFVEEAVPITLNGKWGRRHQDSGLGCSTDDRCAAKRTGRKGPRPVTDPLFCKEATGMGLLIVADQRYSSRTDIPRVQSPKEPKGGYSQEQSKNEIVVNNKFQNGP